MHQNAGLVFQWLNNVSYLSNFQIRGLSTFYMRDLNKTKIVLNINNINHLCTISLIFLVDN